LLKLKLKLKLYEKRLTTKSIYFKLYKKIEIIFDKTKTTLVLPFVQKFRRSTTYKMGFQPE